MNTMSGDKAATTTDTGSVAAMAKSNGDIDIAMPPELVNKLSELADATREATRCGTVLQGRRLIFCRLPNFFESINCVNGDHGIKPTTAHSRRQGQRNSHMTQFLGRHWRCCSCLLASPELKCLRRGTACKVLPVPVDIANGATATTNAPAPTTIGCNPLAQIARDVRIFEDTECQRKHN